MILYLGTVYLISRRMANMVHSCSATRMGWDGPSPASPPTSITMSIVPAS